MAKLPGFTADLGYANAPAAPNPAVVEAAYAAEARGLDARAKGIEIAAAKRGEAVGALAKLAETGYTMKVEQDARTAVEDVINKINEPSLGFVGPHAVAASGLRAQAFTELNAEYAMPSQEPMTEQIVADYEAKAREINAATAQNMLSQNQAQNRLASEMKTLIAAHPAMAERIRKVFNSYTGRGDWDVRPIETALTAKAKEDEAVKARMQRDTDTAKKVFEQGIPATYGIRTMEEVYQHISQGTDTGVKMQAALIASNLTEGANKSLTVAKLNAFANDTFVAAHAARVRQSLDTFAKLKSQGIDFDDPKLVVRPEQYQILRDAYNVSKAAEERQIQIALNNLAKLRSGPEGRTLDVATVEKTVDQLNARLRTLGATQDIDNIITSLKADTVNRNQNIDTLLKTNQVMDSAMARLIPSNLRADLQNPRTRKAVVDANPGNTFIRDLADHFEKGQANFSSNLQNMLYLHDGLFNSSADGVSRAVVMQSQTTTEGRNAIAQVTQARMNTGLEALNDNTKTTPDRASAIATLGENFTPQMQGFANLKRAVVSEEYKKLLGKDTPEMKDFVNKTSARIEYHLRGGNPTAAGNVLKSNLEAVPGASLIVQNGRLAITGFPAMDRDNQDALLALDRSVETVNSLILMQDTLLGTNNRARLFVSPALQMQAETPMSPAANATEPNVRRGQTLRAGVEAYAGRPQWTEPGSATPNLDSMTPGVNPLATQGGPAIPAGSEAEMARRATAAREINAARTGGTNAPTQTPTTPSVVSTANSTTPWWRQ